MPGEPSRHSPAYRERLSLPWHWWLVALAILAVGGAEVGAGFHWAVMLIVYGALGVPTVALLVAMGRQSVSVDADGLHAGGRTLGLDRIESLQVLDAADTRRRMGPAGDPAAHVVVRGWVKTAVLVRPIDPHPCPWWLVSTRHPDALVAAVRQQVSAR